MNLKLIVVSKTDIPYLQAGIDEYVGRLKHYCDFELVVIPGARHTMGETYGEHKRYDFFVRHLLGETPPAWDDLKR